MVGHRYYNPEWRRWIQSAEASSLNPSYINGLNLYCYANNNQVGIMVSWFVDDVLGLLKDGLLDLIFD